MFGGVPKVAGGQKIIIKKSDHKYNYCVWGTQCKILATHMDNKM